MATTTDETIAYRQTDAARLVGVDVRTFRRWARQGLVNGTRIGGVVLYPREQLVRLVSGGAAKQEQR